MSMLKISRNLEEKKIFFFEKQKMLIFKNAESKEENNEGESVEESSRAR